MPKLLGPRRIIDRMTKRQGKIIIAPDLNVWPHELKTAEALAKAGYTVEFIKKSNIDHERAADALIDDERWEMKAPESSHPSVVDKNIKKALSQSCNIVFDSKRMKNAKDSQVLHELEKSIASRRKIRSLIFVDKKGNVHKLK